ncbi:hypothetical protein P3L10_014234 [Capsicum annuum]
MFFIRGIHIVEDRKSEALQQKIDHTYLTSKVVVGRSILSCLSYYVVVDESIGRQFAIVSLERDVEEVKNGCKKLSFGVGTQKTVELQQQDCNS